MGELTLFIFRLAFLAVLWVFVFVVIFALRSDLFGQKVRKLPVAASAPFPAPTPSPRATPAPAAGRAPVAMATRLLITAGAKAGLEVTLPEEFLTIGRSSESGLVIRDDYTSTNHARLIKSEKGWILEDLDSTNGTLLDGSRVTEPTQVPLNVPITIGTTTFELRR
jgi:pSer/pThr/pTyr-binding forkhead associated (FHA) protein